MCTTAALPASAAGKTKAKSERVKEFDLKPYEVRLSVSGFPFSPAFRNDLGVVTGVASSLMWKGTLDEMYADKLGARYTFGNIGAEFTWNAKKWLALSGGLYITPFWADKYDSVSKKKIGTESGASGTLLVMCRFNYFNRRYVRLYSSAGLGVSFSGFRVGLDMQIVPIGVTFGDKVFGFAETGIGSLYLGGNIGIGYRF